MSPRACLIASAASSRSYSEPSLITRSTARRELPGDLVQRHLGNVAIAAALMRQQPMGVLDGALASLDGDIHVSVSLRGKPRGARYRDNGVVSDQHDIDAARKQRGVDGEPFEQVGGSIVRLQHGRAVDAGAAQFEARALASGSRPAGSAWSNGPDIRCCRRQSDRAPAALAASPISAKLQIEESAITGAPVWNFSHLVTSAVSDIAASSQTGVSWSNKVSAIAAVPRITATGAPAAAAIRCTLPGRAIASITERKVDCADSTLSAKPAGSSAIVVITQPSPRTSV